MTKSKENFMNQSLLNNMSDEEFLHHMSLQDDFAIDRLVAIAQSRVDPDEEEDYRDYISRFEDKFPNHMIVFRNAVLSSAGLPAPLADECIEEGREIVKYFLDNPRMGAKL